MSAASHDKPFTVGVTGATGFVGRHVVRELHSRGHTVRALVRDFDRARQTLPPGAALAVKGDATDSAAVDALCKGCDALIHLVGIRRELGRGVTYQRLHVEATRCVLRGAERAGVGRYLHMSALGARPEAPSAYHRTKFEAETLVRASRLDWTIFRPSIIHGPDGEFMQMAAGWVRGEEPPFTFLPYFFSVDAVTGEARAGRAQPVAVEDVAAAFCDALGQPATVGEVYPIGGPDELEWPRMLEIIKSAVPHANEKLRPKGLSGLLVSKAAKTARALGVAGLLPFGPDEPLMGAEDNTCTIAKAREHFGFSPKSFAESVEEYADGL